MAQDPSTPANQPLPASAAVYSRRILSLYDLGVLGFSNSFVWRCPTRLILRLYDRHVSARHLEVGVGTGYFLDRCAFPVDDPALTLLDVNPNSLTMAAQRLQRYQPSTVLADVTAAAPPVAEPIKSIGMNYLLHCLPGTMADKGVAFAHLTQVLAPSGVLFGTTILGQGVPHNVLARRLLRLYNRRGIFGNATDSLDGLTNLLRAHCRSASVQVVGSVAFFVRARVSCPRGDGDLQPATSLFHRDAAQSLSHHRVGEGFGILLLFCRVVSLARPRMVQHHVRQLMELAVLLLDGAEILGHREHERTSSLDVRAW
jgi:ubiquinone/menaquinone biosynthesis C-methylase UbiE